jgi:hypothetical protein
MTIQSQIYGSLLKFRAADVERLHNKNYVMARLYALLLCTGGA